MITAFSSQPNLRRELAIKIREKKNKPATSLLFLLPKLNAGNSIFLAIKMIAVMLAKIARIIFVKLKREDNNPGRTASATRVPQNTKSRRKSVS